MNYRSHIYREERYLDSLHQCLTSIKAYLDGDEDTDGLRFLFEDITGLDASDRLTNEQILESIV